MLVENPRQLDQAGVAGSAMVSIVNQRAIAPHVKDGDWGTAWLSSNSAGSGAYSIDPASYRPLEAVDLIRNKDHFKGWGHNPDPLDVIKVRLIKETSTRVLALLKGDVHATDSYLPTDQVERVQKAEGVNVARDESMRIFLIRMNNKKPPFDNVHARRCFSYAFNYTGFIRDILKNYAERNPAPIPKNLWGYPTGIKGYSFDLEKAKAECDKAPRLDGPGQRRALIVGHQRRPARCFPVDEAGRAFGVEAQHPVPNDLQSDPAGPSRIAA